MLSKASIFFLVMFLFAVAGPAWAIEIKSIQPASVIPGDLVTVSLTDAEDAVVLQLDGLDIPAEEAGPGFATYRVPLVPAGTYVVQFRVGADVVAAPFKLTVLEPAPSISSLVPSNIPECAESEEKRIEVVGRNFLPGSRLLVNGALVNAVVTDLQHMSFDASALGAGVYGVQVVNSSGLKSLPYSLYVNNVPTITSVETGDDFTNHYELVIRGGNFFQQSTLLVTESPPGMTGLSPRQRVIWGKGRRTGAGFLLDEEKEDYLYYEDCHTLIYYRYPLSGQTREMSLKVINPDGKASGSYDLLAN